MSQKSILKGNMKAAFSTPIAAYPWPDSEALNTALKQTILNVEKSDAGVTRSNVGAWHSNDDLLTWDAPCIKTLRERIQTLGAEMTRSTTRPGAGHKLRLLLNGWANVVRDGHYNGVHNHPGALWSGVYYVAGGTPRPGNPYNGKLELLDPRAGANMMRFVGGPFTERHLIDPEPGLMVAFPSWLSHMVHPFFGDGERISISFNIIVSEQKADRPG